MPLWIFGALGWLRKALSALVGLCTRYPLQFALVASLLALGAVWHIKSGQVESANRRTAVQVALVAKWKTANDAAVKWAKAEAARKDTLASDITKGANNVFKPTLAAGQADTARFVRGNRCLRVTPAKGGQLGTDLSGAIHAPGQPSWASGETFVAVADDDPGKCTAAVLRLDNAVNVWAADMIARGLAK